MSRDASASEKNLTVKDTSVKTIVSPCCGVKCEYGEASALQSTEVLHPWGVCVYIFSDALASLALMIVCH